MPELPIYFISIKTSPKTPRHSWPAIAKANQLVRELGTSDARLHFIDVVPAMSDADGSPRRDLFKWDGGHLNQNGYAIWASAVKPIFDVDATTVAKSG